MKMYNNNAKTKYADIIALPHHQSSTRPHMSMRDRAAQFSSYKALSGYEDMVAEEARLTDSMRELSDYESERLDRAIAELQDMLSRGERPRATVTYFEPDRFKSGGRYSTLTAIVKKLDMTAKKLILYGSDDIEDKRVPTIDIPIGRITEIVSISNSPNNIPAE